MKFDYDFDRENTPIENMAVLSMEEMIAEDRQMCCQLVLKEKTKGTYTEETARTICDWYLKFYLEISEEELKGQLNHENEVVRKRAKFLLEKREKARGVSNA